MSATNRNEFAQTKPIPILKLAIESVLIWLFWGLYDFVHETHPLAGDIFFILFFASLMFVLAFIINLVWPHVRVIAVLYCLVCLSFAYFVLAGKWATVMQDIKSFLPAIAAMVTAILWYRVSRIAKKNSAAYMAEMQAMRDELNATKQVATQLAERYSQK